jgi:hypothetical protein
MSIIYTHQFTGASIVYFSFPKAVQFKKALFIPNGALTAHGSNYMTLDVYANDKTEKLVTFTNNSSGGQTYADQTLYEGTNANMDESDFSTSQMMKVQVALTGSGAIDAMLVLEFDEARLY